MTQPIYAIGDIHGHKDALDHALALIAADGGADAHVVFLGDYIDRGPDSRGVLQTLVDGFATGRNWAGVRGNHDRMFCRFVRDGNQHDGKILSGKGWLHDALGGRATLRSYGVNPETDDVPALAAAARAAVPETHLAFLENLPLWHREGPLLFVHAGIRPGVPLEQQTEDDLIWIRDEFLEDDRDHGALIVHGHTALYYPAHFGNRVDLDGGAGYGRPLIPAVFEGRDCWLLTENGREPLVPPDHPLHVVGHWG